jgi:4-diphosphocytidyl-2-C-methyl-D-erythritol kinase
VTDERPRWRLAAPAKLNLSLHVVGRRSDGFHELESLVVLLELADVVSVGDGGAGLTVRGPRADDLPDGPDNLAWRGWLAGRPSGMTDGGLILEKHIPVAAGLGGGSSDAAAAWRLGRHLAGRATADDGPADISALAAIGADVPFFAAAVARARVSGIGERVTGVAPPSAPSGSRSAVEVVLVLPPYGLSTAAVFAELDPADWSGPGTDLESGSNDLLAPARRLRPEIDEVFRVVRDAGGDPHLTGSGPTVFVLTDDPERADSVAERAVDAGLAATRTRLRSEPASIER